MIVTLSSDVCYRINTVLKDQYPNVTRIEQDSDTLFVYTTEALLMITLTVEDYWRHLRLPIEAILVPKIVHALRYGVPA